MTDNFNTKSAPATQTQPQCQRCGLPVVDNHKCPEWANRKKISIKRR